MGVAIKPLHILLSATFTADFNYFFTIEVYEYDFVPEKPQQRGYMDSE